MNFFTMEDWDKEASLFDGIESRLKERLNEYSGLYLVNIKIAKYWLRIFQDILKENKIITLVNLISTSIKDAGAIATAEALKENNTITSLDLSGNNIGEVGAIAIAEALKENNILTSLNLNYNHTRDEGGIALIELLRSNSSILEMNLIPPQEMNIALNKKIYELTSDNRVFFSAKIERIYKEGMNYVNFRRFGDLWPGIKTILSEKTTLSSYFTDGEREMMLSLVHQAKCFKQDNFFSLAGIFRQSQCTEEGSNLSLPNLLTELLLEISKHLSFRDIKAFVEIPQGIMARLLTAISYINETILGNIMSR